MKLIVMKFGGTSVGSIDKINNVANIVEKQLIDKKIIVINNGIDKPHYILDDEGNTDINNIVLAQLPGWDSYNSFTEVFNETWYSATMSLVFDLAKKVDFTVEKITVKINASTTTFTSATTTNNIQLALNSGHLPHLEEPSLVAESWLKFK